MNGHNFTKLAGVGLCLAIVSPSFAQTKDILHHTFEKGGDGWTGFGPTAKISTSQETADVKVGKSSLKFDYSVKKGQFDVLALQLPGDTLTKAKSFNFWVKPDSTGALALSLQEKDGGRYIAIFAVTANKWQQVSVATSDFLLSSEPNDPKDADGKLDLDEVENVSIIDLMQIFAQGGDPAFEKMFSVKMGAHSLLINDFVVSDVAIPGSEPKPGIVEDYTRPQLQWLGIGTTSITSLSGKPLDGPGIKVSYTQQNDKIMGIIRRVPNGALKGSESISFTAASDRKVYLLFQLEQKGGGKFNMSFEIPGDQTSRTYTVKLKDLNLAGDSKDPNAELTLGDVTQLILVDASGISGQGMGDTNLYIGKITAKTTPK